MRFGIIGTGRIARRFVPECNNVPSTEITAVYNPHRESAERFIFKNWPDRESSRPMVSASLKELWEKTDAIYIASPHETHYVYIMEALKNKKHVLCEKPMTLNRQEAQKAYECAGRQGLILMEGLKTAYCPGYRKVLELVRSGIIGTAKYVDACFTKLEQPDRRELNDWEYGGSFTELGSYVLLPILDVLGSEYQSCFFESVTNEAGLDLFTKGSFNYSQAIATAVCGLGVKAEGRLLIGGTRGFIKVAAPWWKTEHIEVHFEDESQTMTMDEVFEGDGLRYEIAEFCRMAEEGRPETGNRINKIQQRSIRMAEIMGQFLQQRRA